MATAETVDLGPPHEPKEESIQVFNEIEHELKKNLVHLRHESLKHDPELFKVAEHLSDTQLATFSSKDFKLVRVAVSAYGIHLFGKLHIPDLPDSGPAYIHFRAFTPGGSEPAKFHSIRSDEKEAPGGHKTFQTIFTDNDPIEWFDA